MRVLVAPDKFAGTLSATQAAEAIAEGWQQSAPADEVVVAPMADGGPGFVDVLHTVLGGRLHALTVRGPLGDPVPVSLLLHDSTAYVESAQACGLHLMPPEHRAPLRATTHGVGEALLAAAQTGVRRIVVGLGGSCTVDAGAGLLGALGATADVPLDAGPGGLDGIGRIDLRGVRDRVAGIELVAAADVSTPLLGLFGATKTFGAQKGLSEDEIIRVDRILDRFVDVACGPTPGERRIADADSAGAAGGLGFALMLLGAAVASGIDVVAQASDLRRRARDSELVVTGEGAFDFSSRAGKVVHGVAGIAADAARPCIVLAGRVDVGQREMRALGVESAYGLTDRVPEAAALADPARHLRELAARVARSWSDSARGRSSN